MASMPTFSDQATVCTLGNLGVTQGGPKLSAVILPPCRASLATIHIPLVAPSTWQVQQDCGGFLTLVSSPSSIGNSGIHSSTVVSFELSSRRLIVVGLKQR